MKSKIRSLKILKKKETQNILRQLNESWGIKEIPGIIARRGEERLFLFTGELEEYKIRILESAAFIERIGVYFAKIVNREIRLSIEGTQIFKDQITKNIFELDEKQTEEWMMGRELLIKTGYHGFIVMKYKDNFLGCGKASAEKIGNFIPKNRRLKNRDN